MRLIATAALGLTLWSSAAFAQEGRYRVEGKDGSNAYAGTATVSRTGDTYRVQWRVGDETYNGTAIGDDKFLAVSFTSKQGGGIALFTNESGSWRGIWTWSGERTLRPEIWTPSR